jgi:hypothetical protein
MASSVSSERAFLQGGITISKQCSCLKGDIVKALQCVKCSLRNNLLFHEPGLSSLAKVEPDDFEIEVDTEKAAMDEDKDEEGWDALFLEEDDDNLELDIDMDEV